MKLTRLLLSIIFVMGALFDASAQLKDLCITDYRNGHAYVDLGLPSGTKWGVNNLKRDYNYKAEVFEAGWNYVQSIYGDRGPWTMPTDDDFKELIDNCAWEWVTYYKQVGYKGTGPNGNYIFLPANFTSRSGNYGEYWSKTHIPRFGIEFYNLYFSSDCSPKIMYNKGDREFNIRPVTY